MSQDQHVVVPRHPTEEMWEGLARDIVMWSRMRHPSGAALYRHLKASGRDIPSWLHDEILDTDDVPPKGDVAVAIYRAMVEKVASLQGIGAETHAGTNGDEIFVVPGYYGNLRSAIRTLIKAAFP